MSGTTGAGGAASGGVAQGGAGTAPPPASGATPPATTPPPPAQPPAAPPAGVFDATAALTPENLGMVQAKGAKDINDVVKSWKASEQLVGHPRERLAVLPANPKGFDDYADVYTQLGAPTDAKDYGLTPAEGANPEFTGKMAEILKAARVTKDQAGVLIPKYNELVNGLAATAKAAAEAKAVADKQALSTKWGAATDQNTAIAKGVARKFGMSEEAIRAMDGAAGHVALMEFLLKIGQGMGEHNFVDGEPGPGLMTPAQAKYARETALADKSKGGWAERYLAGGQKEHGEMQMWLAAENGIDLRELKK